MPKIVDHDERRKEIADVAARLFAQRGLKAASMQQIANAAGIAKGSIYKYFQSKENLLKYMIENSLHMFAQSLQQHLQAIKTPAEKLTAIAKYFTWIFTEHETLMIVYLEIFTYNLKGEYPQLKHLFEQYLEQTNQMIADILEAGKRSGNIREDVDSNMAAAFTTIFFDGFGVNYLYNKSYYDVETVVKHFMKIFLEGIQRRD